MKKILNVFLVLLVFGMLSSCTKAYQIKTYYPAEQGIVIYFSATNNTETVAKKVASTLNLTLFELVPEEIYTDEDLDYTNSDSRTSKEQNDNFARPAIAQIPNLTSKTVIFLGYPIWHGKLPKIIYTFLESQNFDGKTIIPFCTSGGSSIDASAEEIKALMPNIYVNEGRRLSASVSSDDILKWMKAINVVQED